MNKRGLLLSGGMDSTAIAYWLKPDYALTIDYGQNSAKAEIDAAKKISSVLNIAHSTIKADCSELGSGDLLKMAPESIATKSDWWPFRNQLLATLGGMAAVKLGLTELILGSVSSDQYHKDGTIEFYQLISQLMSYQEGGIVVSAPAIKLTTTQLIEKSGIPRELLMWSHSCHKSNIPCQNCRGCNKYFSTLNALYPHNE
jgi:7-cyano-7-deazaguanine synthase